MAHNKRLFLFAGYNKDNALDESLVYYVKKLSAFGDIILCMDNDCKKSELAKVKSFVIHAMATRHGEYDFGSYKRAFQYAKNKKLLSKYTYLYLVNDSVFGPFIDIKPTIKNIEQIPTDAAGIAISKHKTHSFMESWFVRINKKVFLSDWFDKFISNVKCEDNKFMITVKYEHGLTNVIKNNGGSCGGIYSYPGRSTYNRPKRLFKGGCPFVKKMSFTRHNGGIGNQIKYIFNHSDPVAIAAITKTANRIYGEKYMKWLLTYNPFKILWRNATYAIKKIQNGGI